jgi:hypothetical protein
MQSELRVAVGFGGNEFVIAAGLLEVSRPGTPASPARQQPEPAADRACWLKSLSCLKSLSADPARQQARHASSLARPQIGPAGLLEVSRPGTPAGPARQQAPAGTPPRTGTTALAGPAGLRGPVAGAGTTAGPPGRHASTPGRARQQARHDSRPGTPARGRPGRPGHDSTPAGPARRGQQGPARRQARHASKTGRPGHDSRPACQQARRARAGSHHDLAGSTVSDLVP